jgi:hypothetical protein
MWWNIIKCTKQSSRQLINLDWDEEAISIEDEDCLKWLVEYHNIIVKYDDLVTHRIPQGPITNKIPNEVACLVKQKFQQDIPSPSIDFNEGGINVGISFELRPSKVGTGWFDIFIFIGKEDTPEYFMNSGLTRTWARCPPEMEIERINSRKGTDEHFIQKNSFVSRFNRGKNTWTRRMCQFLKELINHTNNPNLSDYCIDALAEQWFYWAGELNDEDKPLDKKILSVIKETIETQYWN